jgi:hypothetical protein
VTRRSLGPSGFTKVKQISSGGLGGLGEGGSGETGEGLGEADGTVVNLIDVLPPFPYFCVTEVTVAEY